jgi:DNA polymerase-4
VARAHGHETTFQADLVERGDIDAALMKLAEQVIADLRREERRCQRVFLKVRFAPFFTFNRSRKLKEPTYDPAVIAAVAGDLFTALGDDRPVRLLGIRGEMVDPS